MVQSLFKTGVAAHIVGMPANTLRVWERRYGLQCQQLDDHGHRLYSADDVQRIAALRQLTLQGHAIGVVAGLTQSELRDLLSSQDQVREVAQAIVQPVRPVRQLQVVGAALANRIRRAAPRRQLRIAATFNTLPEATATAPAERPAVDALLLHLPSLHAQQVEEMAAAAAALGVTRVLVVYGYSNSQALRRCTELGIQPWRDTHNDRSLLGWILDSLGGSRGAAPAAAPAGQTQPLPPVQPPQYDEATLADWSTRKTDVACECPAHVAELLLRLQQFETYSADCEHRNEDDRRLHEQLHQLAGTARGLLERAMGLLAEHEQSLNLSAPH